MHLDNTTAIAIVGMGCRFPGGASTPDAYWELLRSAQDATCEVPADRWSLRRFHDPDNRMPGKILTSRGGFLRQSIRAFDANFFGISPREAESMDPQQRILLEVAWEAFEDAGIVPGDLRGTRTGVYVGGFTTDNLLHQLNALNREAISSHSAVGATLTMLANRLSYVFDLQGPSMTVDTACSSSLVAMHLAVQSLRAQECIMALVGGVNVMFRPAYSIAMSKGGFLSPDGRCKTFDARGDGYGRGEGAGLLVLKRLDAAQRAGDRIHAIIVETGVNQDGRTDGITLPSQRSQVELIRDVYKRAGVAADAVSYVEAHGTGTKAGDATELNALSEAIAGSRANTDRPLLVGSAKSNIGHLEAAAGVAGVIKTVLALRNGAIPPSIHFREPPESIDHKNLGIEVVTKLRAWPETTDSRLASVNAFGYGGTNAHALLCASPAVSPLAHASEEVQRPYMLTLSARSERALAGQVNRLHQCLSGAPNLSLRDLGYTLARRRSHLPYRTAFFARTVQEALDRLREIANSETADLSPALQPKDRSSERIAFVYTGMGTQSWGMGRGLLADPVAAQALKHCDAIWHSLAGWSLSDLFSRDGGGPMCEPAFAQPANFAVQVMLTEVARSHGLHPTAIIGHSAGEMAAAWAAGSLTLEQALTVTWHRSRLQQRCHGAGAMLAVGLAEDDVARHLLEHLDIAAVNGPRSIVLTGAPDRIENAAVFLTESGIFNRKLSVEVAYHSRQMTPLKEEFMACMADLTACAPIVPLYSSVTGARVFGATQDAAYWWRNLRDPVAFQCAVESMIDDDVTLFQEIGPQPALGAGIVDCLRTRGRAGSCHGSMRRGEDDLDATRNGIITSYIRGAAFDWSTIYPKGELISLLPYAWDREDLWFETAISQADRLGSNEHPIVNHRAGEAVSVWDGELKRGEHRFLSDHKIEGTPIFPAAGHIELALAAREDKSSASAIEDLYIDRALETFSTPVLRMHLDHAGQFSIFCREPYPDRPWSRAAGGRLVRATVPPVEPLVDRAAILGRCGATADVDNFYNGLSRLGIDYGPSFRTIEAAWIGGDECLAQLRLSEPDHDKAASYFLHPALMDGALQAALLVTQERAKENATIALPVGFSQLRYQGPLGTSIWCHTLKRGESFDIRLFDEDGTTRAELFGLRLKPAALRTRDAPKNLLYGERWLPAPVKDTVQGPRKWLIFADRQGFANAIQSIALEKCEIVRVERMSETGFAGWIADMDVGRFDDILYLWPLDLPDGLQGHDDDLVGRSDCLALLAILKCVAALQSGTPPIVTICTCEAEPVMANENKCPAPGQSAVRAAMRAARMEMPHAHLRSIDLASRIASIGAAQIVSELFAVPDEPEIAYRLGQRYASRISPYARDRYRIMPSTDDQRFTLTIDDTQDIAQRRFIETGTACVGENDVEIKVISVGFDPSLAERISAWSLNASLPRQECIGTITAVGAATSDLAIGGRVLAFIDHAPLASHHVISADCIVPLPTAACDDAGTVFTWLAAHYALGQRAHLKPGDWVLVCDAGTGTALATALYALRAGAKVIATAETAAERKSLEEFGCTMVLDSTTLTYRDVALQATNGRGVDIAFGSNVGDLRLAALDTVAFGGIYLDGNTDGAGRQDAIPMRYVERDISIIRIDLAAAIARHSAAIKAAITELPNLMAASATAGLPARLLPGRDIDFALKAARHKRVGRTALLMTAHTPILRQRSPLILDPDATYLVTGGFGGIGLAVLEWLAARGARSLAVISRSGASTPEARRLIQRLEIAGVRVQSETTDVGNAADLARALTRIREDGPPIRGVIHGAGVLADAPITTIDAASLDRTIGAKARGALHLHRLLSDAALDFFVCHGSIAAAWGNSGQYNYAAANGFLAGLMRHRRAVGLPGSCINWGPIAEAGMAARDDRLSRHFERLGLRPLPLEAMLSVLEDVIVEGWDICDVADIAWNTWRHSLPEYGQKRIADLVSDTAECATGEAEAFRARLSGKGKKERHAQIFEMLIDAASPILKLPKSRFAPTTSLSALGADSLMAVEIADAIHRRTDVRPRIISLINSQSLTELVEKLETEVQFQ
jgi:acyl transferase domain-containing protein/NAD(P)-dependent dehydrogenase (short-subunit alcohol dehydrogenase family)/acyl carrier protein